MPFRDTTTRSLSQTVTPLRILQKTADGLANLLRVWLDSNTRRLIHQLPGQADIRCHRAGAAAHRPKEALGRIIVQPLQAHEHARPAEPRRTICAKASLAHTPQGQPA